MAKKRKKDKAKEEEYEFKPPEFSEKDFLEKELRDTRTALYTIGYAVVIGIVAGLISILDPDLAVVSFAIGLAGIVSLKFYYGAVKVDTSTFLKKNWAGNTVTFFFTFLAIWVLLMNVPFADLTDPSVEKVVVWVNDGTTITGVEYKKSPTTGALTWLRLDNNLTPEGLIHASTSYTINITANIADSGGISVAEIAFNSTTAGFSLMTKGSSGKYEYSIPGNWLNPSTGLVFLIHATDRNGNEQTFQPPAIPVSP